MVYSWPSPAKINLFLYVTGRRNDSYHYIQTLFQFLKYGDELKIIPNKTGLIKLSSNNTSILNKKNSILSAAKLLKDKAYLHKKNQSITLGAKIFLNKRIPIGSGLGGGSSNAATTLIVLNKLWKINFTLKELALFSLQIGSDIPGFIMGKTSIIEGIGNLIHPIERKKKWYVIIYPNETILTKNMFIHPLLSRNTPYRSITKLLRSPFKNDFEHIAKKNSIKIKKLISMLSFYAPTRMTGTGSCIFTEFGNKKSAQKIISILPKNMPYFLTDSVNTSPLHDMIKNCNLIFKKHSVFY